MSGKPFTIDLSRESLYVYAPLLVTEVLRGELNPVQFDKTVEQLSTFAYRGQVINKIFDRVMKEIVVKFKNDTKVVADCGKRKLTPEDLKEHYNMRVIDAVDEAFNEWQAKHPERQFKKSPALNFESASLLDSCVII